MRNLDMFVVYEGIQMDEYDILREALIEEGAALDIYHMLKNTKASYSNDMNEFYNMFENGDVKGAKAKLQSIKSNLVEINNKVKSVDDSTFSSKVGEVCFHILASYSKIALNTVKSIAGGAVGGAAADAIINRKAEGGIKNSIKNAAGRNLGKSALKHSTVATLLLSTAPSIINQISQDLGTLATRKAKIRKLMKDGMSESEAKVKVGGMYKNVVSDYIGDLIRQISKIEVNISSK